MVRVLLSPCNCLRAAIEDARNRPIILPSFFSSFFFFCYFFVIFSQRCEFAKNFLCPKAASAGSLSSSVGMKRLYLGWLILCGQEMGAAVGTPLSLPPWGRGGSTVKSFHTVTLEVKGREGGSHRGDSLNRIHPSKPLLALSTNHIQFPVPQWLY